MALLLFILENYFSLTLSLAVLDLLCTKIPQFILITMGSRAFWVAGNNLWKYFAQSLQEISSLYIFKMYLGSDLPSVSAPHLS